MLLSYRITFCEAIYMPDLISTSFEVPGERLRNGDGWAAGRDRVHCCDPDGSLIGRLKRPELVSGLTFADAKRDALGANIVGARYPRRPAPHG
jgi:hypothetical protein